MTDPAGKKSRPLRSLSIPAALLAVFLGAVLLGLLPAGIARSEERHAVLLRFSGGGYVGNRQGNDVSQPLLPQASFRDADDRKWTLEELRNLPGFRVESAYLRFTVSDIYGKKMKYALSCGTAVSAPSAVHTGRVIWDVTSAVSAWLKNGSSENALSLTGAHQKKDRWVQIEEGSVRLQLNFTADESLPLFPLDRVEEEILLDNSLCFLETDHPVLRHYNDVSGSLAASRWPLGVPYYFGGVNEEKILHRYFPRQVTNYYRADRKYICGLDCSGFINLALEKSEKDPVSISEIIGAGQGSELLKSHPSRWPSFLLPGDLIAMSHGKFYHVVMYLGTLRTFGWTGETAGEALPVLDMPLVVHCGENPFYYDRYQNYIREQGYTNTYPPDGGVTVSVIMPNPEGAPNTMKASWGDTFYWYQLEGTPLLVFSLQGCTGLSLSLK